MRCPVIGCCVCDSVTAHFTESVFSLALKAKTVTCSRFVKTWYKIIKPKHTTFLSLGESEVRKQAFFAHRQIVFRLNHDLRSELDG